MYCKYIKVLVLLIAIKSKNIVSASRLHMKVPKEEMLQDSFNKGKLANDMDENSFDELNTPARAEKLRSALRALLQLNDGELEVLLKGLPVDTIKNQISPSTAFILQASSNRLERLRELLSEHKNLDTSDLNLQSLEGDLLDGDLRIARRRKKSNRPRWSGSFDSDLKERNFEESSSTNSDSDSLLGALTDLSESIKVDRRRQKKAQRNRKRHLYNSHNNIHYEYWLKPAECPDGSDDFPKVHCPSPTRSGEWVCVDDRDLCDGHSQCPGHEDENPMACLFFKSMQSHVDLLISALLRSRRS